MASSAKLALARVLSSRPVGRAVGAATRHRVPNHGLRFETRGWEPRIEAMLAFRIYESAEIRFIREHMLGVEQAIELGGSLGVAGSHLLDVMADNGRLVSVEANPELLDGLERTLRDHAGQRSVSVIHAAISDSVRATLSPSKSSLSSQLGPTGIDVPAFRLEEIVATVDFNDYALVSDIEGAETSFILDPGALVGCTRMVIELHDSAHRGIPVAVGEMVTALRSHGFRLLDRHGPVCAFAR